MPHDPFQSLIRVNAPQLHCAKSAPCLLWFIVVPRAGLNVQHCSAEEAAPERPLCTYESVVCKACTRIHFVNRLTGKLLGEPETDIPAERS